MRRDDEEKNGERIAKVMAAAGVCSRRDAEKLIAQGVVKVNGKKITTPATFITEEDRIHVRGEEVFRETHALPRVFLYHKPEGLLTTHKDPEGRATVFDSLPLELPRVVSVGRLDVNSEGLLLLTTSGALSRAMELPTSGLPRTYRARVSSRLSDDAISLIRRGITIEGVRYKPAQIEEETTENHGRNRWYRVRIVEGKNREIRRIFGHYEVQVSRLIRIGYGQFELGTLARGEVKEVPRARVKKLMESLEL
jgi:23S rRNA pseudouridine2605 synthase